MLEEISIIGYAAKDPKKISPDKYPNLISFSVGVSNNIKNKETGEYESKTNWYNIMYNSQINSSYLFDNIKKGDKIFVKGKIGFDPWVDTAGEKQIAVRINANHIEIMKKSEFLENTQMQKLNIDSKNSFLELDDSIPF